MRLAVLFALLAGGCSTDIRSLEAVHAELSARRDQLHALSLEIDREPGQMKRMIAEVERLRAEDPAYNTKTLLAALKAAVPQGVDVNLSGDYLWFRANPSIPVAGTVAAAARVAPHLTASLFFLNNREWGLDVYLPELAMPGAYSSATEPDEVILPKQPFWPSAASRELRADTMRLQSEVAELQKRIGALSGMPALRGRLDKDRARLASGARLDRAVLLVGKLFGQPAVFKSGSLTFHGDETRIAAELTRSDSNLADLLVGVVTAEEGNGDRGWSFNDMALIRPGIVDGSVSWRARR
jgi:hypothetical protein